MKNSTEEKRQTVDQGLYEGFFIKTVSYRLVEDSFFFGIDKVRTKVPSKQSHDEIHRDVQSKLLKLSLHSSFNLVSVIDFATKVGGRPRFSGSCNPLTEFYVLPYLPTPLLEISDLPSEKLDEFWDQELEGMSSAVSISGNHEIFPNEFMLMKNEQKQYDSHQNRAVYDISLLLGQRRSSVFESNFAQRLYNIFLPPGILSSIGSCKESYLVIPVLMFNRMSNTAFFRRTFSISIIFIPLNDELSAISSSKFCTLLSNAYEVKAKYSLNGDLKEWLEFEELEFFNIRILEDKLFKKIQKLIICEPLPGRAKRFPASSCGIHEEAAILTTKDVSATQIESFITKGAMDSSFHQLLDDLMFPYLTATYYIDFSLKSPSATIDYNKLLIAPEFGIDSRILVFKNLQSGTLVALEPKDFELFPLHSVKWMFPWTLYQMANLSALKASIQAFYFELESKPDTDTLLELENTLVTDLDEYYDLDISSNWYKQEYEKTKKISGVNRDYERLLDKLRSLRDNQNLKEQRNSVLAQEKTNKLQRMLSFLLVMFTVVIAIGTVIHNRFGIVVSFSILAVSVLLLYYVLHRKGIL
jgi:hypothetical protein